MAMNQHLGPPDCWACGRRIAAHVGLLRPWQSRTMSTALKVLEPTWLPQKTRARLYFSCRLVWDFFTNGHIEKHSRKSHIKETQAFRLAATDRSIVNLRESGPVAVGLMSLWPSNCWACGCRIAGPAPRHSFVGLADNFAVSVTLRRSWFGSARLAFMACSVLFSSSRALLSCGGGARWADHMALQRAHARFGERCRQRRVQRAQLVWRSWPVM